MFGTKRLAKRSIIGTQVAAKWQDGRYYPGVIEGEYCEESPFNDAVYCVKFEDGYQKNINSKNIVGPGFQTKNSVLLKNGQKVFLTLNGREVTGLVIKHSVDDDQVIINAQLNNGSDTEVTKRTEEVRLLKSRKSARLADQDTDYSKLADFQLSEAKKRTVSSGIDVPNKQSRYRQSQVQDVRMADDQDSSMLGDDDDDSDVEMMDEEIAAMVLTSLSCSPQSPQYTSQEFKDFSKTGPLSSSVSSSGYHSNQSDRSDRSPPSHTHLSESAPAATGMLFSPFGRDECFVLKVGRSEEEMGIESKKVFKRTMYQCTWPGCTKVSSTSDAIERHVRDTHLGIAVKEGDDSDTNSCREEEFYYTEIEVNVENVTQGFSDMCSSSSISPPVAGTELTSVVIPDHDYQKKEFRHSFASSVPTGPSSPAKAIPIPVKVNEIQRSLSWQNSHTYAASPSPPIRPSAKLSAQERLQQHQAQSPKVHMIPVSKTLSIHKKPRSEVRKCRKVYGMENRDMWCTQCKWKKACTRFLD